MKIITIFDFQKIIPIPSNIYTGDITSQIQQKYGENTWYQWCRKNWGTKWPACEIEEYQEGSDYIYIFDTAWNWPLPIFKALARKISIYFQVQLYQISGSYYKTLYYKDGKKLTKQQILELSN